VGVEVEGEAVGEGSAGDGQAEVFLELGGLRAGVDCEMATVRYLSGNYHSCASIDVEDAAVGMGDEKFGEDLFLCSEDHAVLALDSYDCPGWGETYSADSTALTAYSSWSSRPSWV
jgi:hypothetical protein